MLEWTTNGNPINSNSPNTTGELIPYIESFSPSMIPATGTTEVLITGGNFIPTNNLSIPASTLNISGASSVVYSVISPTKISAIVTTNNASGNLPVVISNGDRLSSIWGDKSISILFDPYFQNIILFLRGEGENNSTNIIDSSSTPKSLVRGGNTCIRTTQKKYGNSSIYFDGSGDYLLLPASGDFSFSADFTIEFWYYHQSAPESYARLFKQREGDIYGGIELIFNNANQVGLYYSTNNAWHNVIGGTIIATLTQGNWHHIALSNKNNTFKVFLNGATTFTYTNFPVYDNSANTGSIGGQVSPSRSINGYIDCFRITKGVGRYSGDFNTETDTSLF